MSTHVKDNEKITLADSKFRGAISMHTEVKDSKDSNSNGVLEASRCCERTGEWMILLTYVTDSLVCNTRSLVTV